MENPLLDGWFRATIFQYPLFSWPFSIAMFSNTRGYIPLDQYKIPWNHYKIPLNHYKIPLNHYKNTLRIILWDQRRSSVHQNWHFWAPRHPRNPSWAVGRPPAIQRSKTCTYGILYLCMYIYIYIYIYIHR